MATAPLSLYAETPEEQSAVQQYRDAQKTLLESLEGRKQLLDPTLLAMAQGFLAPTKTGSFGEALGNVATQLAPVQAAEEKRAQEIAKMRYELAQQNLAATQATSGEAMFRNLIGRGAPGAPKAADGAVPATPGASGAAQPPAGGRSITAADIALLASKPGMEKKAQILSDMIKSDRDRFAISMNGIVFDRDTQQYLNLEIPGQKQEAFSTPYGRFEMTPNEYSQFRRAESEGQGQQWIDNFRKPGGLSSAAGAPAGRLTVEEQAAKAKGAETKATETAKSEVSRTQEMINAGQDATGRMASYSSLRGIASRPDAGQIFGIFNRPDVGTAILNLVNEGVRSQSGSIQVGALEDTLRNVGLPQDQIDRYRFALSTMANIQLQQAKLAAGQGAVSNFERDLFANATISPKDNPQTILAKLSMLEARADFDRKRASALRRSKMDADDFMDSPEYQKMVQEYLGRVSSISSNFGSKAPAGAGKPKFEYLGVEKKGG